LVIGGWWFHIPSVEFGELVVGEGFGWEEVEGAGLRILAQGVEAAERAIDGFGLVAVELVYAAGVEGGVQAWIEAGRDRREVGWSRGQGAPGDDVVHEFWVGAEVGEEVKDGHGWGERDGVTSVRYGLLFLTVN